MIEAPGVKYYSSGTITSNSDIFIALPTDLRPGSHNFDKGIHLTANSHKVSVIGQNLHPISSDTFLCLPVKNLCLTEYVYYGISVEGMSKSSNFTIMSSILVVGTKNFTVVKLVATKPLNITINRSDPVILTAGMQNSSMINRFDTKYIESINDLTGIKIVTNQPVSVLSGHRCGKIPFNVSQCDHLVEQVPPATLWGRVYYTAPLATRRSYTVKVLAAYNSTTVDVYCNNTKKSYNISEGESINETLSMHEYCAIKSTKEVLVAQFSHGYFDDKHGSRNGDPMMTLVPATNQYSNKFKLSTLEVPSNFTHYINIIVLAEYYQCDMIYLTSGGVNRSLNMSQWTPIMLRNITEAYALQVNISKGVSEVFHCNTSALIATSVYGFANFSAYGHPGGYNTIKACAGCYACVIL